MIKQCAKCGIDEHHETMHTHHIDFDHFNDVKENRIVLCSSCHRLIHQGKWDIKELGIEVLKYNTDTIRNSKLQKEALDKFKKLYNGSFDRGHVQEELPRVSRSTLNALVKRGVLHVTKGVFGDEGPDYYYWTEKEV